MKVCQTCGDTYKDHVDFCFNDGEVLVLADAATTAAAMAESELDAPLPRLIQGAQGPSSADTIPMPRPRGGPVRVETPVETVAEPVPAANTPKDPVDETEAPVHALDDRSQPDDVELAIDDAAETIPPPVSSSSATIPPALAATPPPVRSVLSGAETMPPLPEDQREPIRVAPLPSSEAQTVPFIRPQQQIPTPVTPEPRRNEGGKGAQPVRPSGKPQRKREGGVVAAIPPEPPRDPSNLLWFGAIAMVSAMAVPFIIGALIVYFAWVGGWGSETKEPGTDGIAVQPAPVPVVPEPVFPEPVELPEPETQTDDGAVDGTPDEPPGIPTRPSVHPQQPKVPSELKTVSFQITPPDARDTARVRWVRPPSGAVSNWDLGGKEQVKVPDAPEYEFEVRAGESCREVVSWDGESVIPVNFSGNWTNCKKPESSAPQPVPAQPVPPAPAETTDVLVFALSEKNGGASDDAFYVNGDKITSPKGCAINCSLPLPRGTHKCDVRSATGAILASNERCVITKDTKRIVPDDWVPKP